VEEITLRMPNTLPADDTLQQRQIFKKLYDSSVDKQFNDGKTIRQGSVPDEEVHGVFVVAAVCTHAVDIVVADVAVALSDARINHQSARRTHTAEMEIQHFSSFKSSQKRESGGREGRQFELTI